MADKHFLDSEGLLYLWGKIKAKFATQTSVTTALASKQDIINDLDTIRSGATAGATALQPNDIAAWAKAADKPEYDSDEISHEFDSDISLTPDVGTVEEALNYLYTFSEDVQHKVTSSTGISASSTDGQYPSAKATYNAVNAKADKATTLAGYGITDAYTKTETDTAINNAKYVHYAATYTFSDDILNGTLSMPTQPMQDIDCDVRLAVTDTNTTKYYALSKADNEGQGIGDFVGFIEWNSAIYKIIIHPRGMQPATPTVTEIKGGDIEVFHAITDGSTITFTETISSTILDGLDKPAMVDLTIDVNPAVHILLTQNGVDVFGETDSTYYFEGITNFDIGDYDATSGYGYTYLTRISISGSRVAIHGSEKFIKDNDLASWAKSSTKPSYAASEISYGSNSNVDTALGALDSGKADKSTTYTKTEVDTALSAKANQSTTYTKTEVDTALAAKANQSTTYTKTETDSAISTAIGSITGISFEIVQTLPATGDAGKIYLKPNSGSGQNIYDEYIYFNNAWEKIGTTEVDLSNYYTKAQIDDKYVTNAEIDTIVAT